MNGLVALPPPAKQRQAALLGWRQQIEICTLN